MLKGVAVGNMGGAALVQRSVLHKSESKAGGTCSEAPSTNSSAGSGAFILLNYSPLGLEADVLAGVERFVVFKNYNPSTSCFTPSATRRSFRWQNK